MGAKRLSVARRYAEAFSGVDAEQLRAMISELDRLLQQLTHEAPLWARLNNPTITPLDRIEHLKEHHQGLSPDLLALLRLIMEHERIELLPEIVTALHRRQLDESGQVQLTVTSAVALTEHQLDALQRALDKRLGRTVTLQPKVDDHLLGGLLITGDAWELDLTLRTRLAGLQKQLAEGEVRP